MQKVKLGVVFGGMSTENKVSVSSAKSVLHNLDEKKYEIYPIFISEGGKWYKVLNIEEIDNSQEEIKNVFEYLEKMEVIFPVLHGLYGEDGTIQGLFKLLNKRFVGCGVLSSSVGMDKVYSKIIFEKARIKSNTI